MNTQQLRRVVCLAVMTLAPMLAQAHPGHGPGYSQGYNQGFSFYSGLLHPWSGLDHLLAMLAVGLWASQLGGRMRWALPACFVASMLVGASFGLAGAKFGAVEQGIAASVLILGVLVASAKRVPLAFSLLLTGCFAIFHGYAHGAEMSAQNSALNYILGFTLSTAALHLVGLTLGGWFSKHSPQSLRWTGVAIGACGAALLMS